MHFFLVPFQLNWWQIKKFQCFYISFEFLRLQFNLTFSILNEFVWFQWSNPIESVSIKYGEKKFTNKSGTVKLKCMANMKRFFFRCSVLLGLLVLNFKLNSFKKKINIFFSILKQYDKLLLYRLIIWLISHQITLLFA